MTYRINTRLRGFECLRCGTLHPVRDYPTGCLRCLDAGFPASVKAAYEPGRSTDATRSGRGISRFASLLPFLTFPSLGEGDTPLVEAKGIARDIHLAALHIKCEFQSPTGSHKDRMSCLVMARAVQVQAPAVVVASSGNAGVSVAAYAAAAGIRCVVVTTLSMNPIWRRAIELTGAELVATRTSQDRWRFVAEQVSREGWYPASNFIEPPVGSNCWGVDGYKTIGFELAEALGPEIADFVFVPTSRGDLLWGIYEGFRVLLEQEAIPRIPCLVAVEPHPRLERVLAGDDHRGSFPGQSALVSIGGSTVTWQAVHALSASSGHAVAVDETAAVSDQKRLAEAGIYLELSSAAALSALHRMRDLGTVPEGARVVLIGTANGFREMPQPSASPIRPVQL